MLVSDSAFDIASCFASLLEAYKSVPLHPLTQDANWPQEKMCPGWNGNYTMSFFSLSICISELANCYLYSMLKEYIYYNIEDNISNPAFRTRIQILAIYAQ